MAPCPEELAVTALWMLNLMGDLAKEPEGLLIFNFFPLKKPLTKSYGTGIGYCQEILVMDTVRNARPDQTK